MSTREGKLITCERCGKQLFLERTGIKDMDGGYSSYETYQDKPEGWESVSKPGGKGYMEVCPGCWEEYLRLLGKFWTDKKG